MFGTGTINLVDFFGIWIIGIQSPKLALGITEKEQKVWAVAAVDNVQHPVSGVCVHHPGEDHELDGVEDNCPVGLGCGLAIQSGS